MLVDYGRAIVGGYMEDLRKLISSEWENRKEKSEELKIPLSAITYGVDEIMEVLDSMLSAQVTMGKKVGTFERMFADYIGVKHGIMVNSGSSANLIAMSLLTNPVFKNRIKKGSEVITPAVTWSTTVFSIIHAGLRPLLIDVDEDYLIDIEKLKESIGPKTKAILLVHLLGNPCDMKAIMDIAQDHKLFLIEDCCEAHGAEYRDKKVGSFGDISTYSFYFSHHITTIEGGIVLTNDDMFADLSRIFRAHGWIREVSNREELIKKYSDIDPRFLFVNIGHNLRPTDLQGAIGIHQMNRLEGFIKIRRENAEFWNKSLKKYEDSFILPKERDGTRHTWLAYPLTIRHEANFTRKQLIEFLESKNIKTRPIVAGNMSEQPALRFFKHKETGLKNSEYIMRNSFYIGNHQEIRHRERQYFVECMDGFMSNIKS